MLVNPRANIGLIAVPKHRGSAGQFGSMKAERAVWSDANLIAGNVGEQNRASRLARPDNSDVDTARREFSPPRVVGDNTAAVAIGNVDRCRRVRCWCNRLRRASLKAAALR